MSSAIARRIHRLEGKKRPEPCHVCGAPDAPCQYRVHMEGFDPPCDTPEHCPGCGRKQVYTLQFDRPGDDEP